jgi:CRP/FNR family transcriptional regulator, cyclic AMP receptor protein
MRLAHIYDDSFHLLRDNLRAWSIPEQITDEIVEHHVPVAFAKGAMIFTEGSTHDLFACVLSGYVKIYCPFADGSRTLMRLAGPGEIAGYADYIDSKGRRARLFEGQSLGKSTVALMSREDIARLLRRLGPDALVDLLETLNTFWSLNTRWFATLIGLPIWERLELVLNDLARHTGVTDARGTMLIPELAHEDLAEMIGCSRPMVGRLIGQMVEAELIERSGKRYILRKKWDTNSKGYLFSTESSLCAAKAQQKEPMLPIRSFSPQLVVAPQRPVSVATH